MRIHIHYRDYRDLQSFFTFTGTPVVKVIDPVSLLTTFCDERAIHRRDASAICVDCFLDQFGIESCIITHSLEFGAS